MILEDPRVTISRKAEKYGHCSSCGLYDVVIPPEAHLCRACYIEKKLPEWELEHKTKLKIIENEKLKHAWENEVKKRHDKGYAPINLRH